MDIIEKIDEAVKFKVPTRIDYKDDVLVISTGDISISAMVTKAQWDKILKGEQIKTTSITV